MSPSGRRRASLLVLLVLAAGLAFAAAGAAFAASAHEMACCPAEAGDERGCAWLGAGDCCPERPSARAPAGTNGAPPSAAHASTPAAPPSAFAAAAVPSRAFAASSAHLSRSAVLRL
jgi:hypothetical protein